MKKYINKLVLIISIVGVSCFGQAFTIAWNTSSPAVDQLGNPLADGSLAQLIVTLTSAGGSPTALDISSTNGLTGSDRVVSFASSSGQNIANSLSSDDPTPPVGGSDNIFVRVFNSPSSNAGSNIPTPIFDAGQGSQGIWYADMPVVQLQNPTIFAQYQFAVTQGDWTFAAVPEPSTIMFLGIGTVAILLRRARRRS